MEQKNKKKTSQLIESLVKECLKNKIRVCGVELYNDELAYHIDGFSKSGTAFLCSEGDKVLLKTRYDQVDVIEKFEDIVDVAYQWNEAYCTREPFGWDGAWVKLFKNFGKIL